MKIWNVIGWVILIIAVLHVIAAIATILYLN